MVGYVPLSQFLSVRNDESGAGPGQCVATCEGEHIPLYQGDMLIAASEEKRMEFLP